MPNALRISLNDAALDDAAMAAITELVVVQDTRGLASVELTADAWDEDTRGWRMIDSVREGDGITVVVGDRAVFVGAVTALDLDLGAGDEPQVRVRGYDHRVKLARARKTVLHRNLTDGELLRRLGQAAGVAVDVASTSAVHTALLQAEQTDLELLDQRAAALGFDVLAHSGTLVIGPPAFDARPAAELGAADLLDFRGTISIRDLCDGLGLRAWDARQKQVRAVDVQAPELRGLVSGPARARRAFGAAADARSDAGSPDARADLEARARADMLRAALEHCAAEALVLGDPALAAGACVDLQGLGARFSGPYYIQAAEHRWRGDESYRTHLTLRRYAS